MKILICCATPDELKVVKEEIKKLNLKIPLPIEYLCTGIGNHLTILQLTKYLTEHAEEKYFIVNVGVCGWSSWTQWWRSHETDRIQGNCIQASVVEHLNIRKEAIIPIFIKLATLGKCISSEVVVDDVAMLNEWKDEVIFVDMESWWIELVVQHFQLPRLLLKVPIDEVGEETKQFNRTVALEKLRNQIDYKELVEKVVAYIHTLK